MRFDSFVSPTALTLIITLTLTLVLHAVLMITKGDHHYVYALDNTSLADFNFAAVGDWGCTHNTQNTINNIIDKSPELVLGLGDYSYNNYADCWLRLIDPIYDKMKIVLGNHEHLTYTSRTSYYSSPERLQEYMNYFNLSRQFYSFNYQNVHFIAMSTEVPYERGSKQYNFVKSDLRKAVSAPGIDWIVVFYHRAAYTSPSVIGSIPALRDTYHLLFEKYGVDLVIQAHIHNYQRSYPIKYNDEDSLKPFITDRNTASYHNPKGQIYTIVGTGGSSEIHNFTGRAARYMAVQFNAFGFLNINVLHNGTTMEGNFYENNGTVRDHFTIVKADNKNHKSDSSSSSSSPSVQSLHSSSSSALEPRLAGRFEDKFKIHPVFKGLNSATDMAFLSVDDLLVLEKRTGLVQRVVNGNILGKPLLDVSVSNKVERGLLGIAISKENNVSKNVYLYYTEGKHDGDDICPKPDRCIPGTEPIGNRLYRYELTMNDTKLINPKLLLDLPATPGPEHNGGKMIIGADNNVYIIIGDIRDENSKTQNYVDGKEPIGVGGILKVDQAGRPLDDAPLGSKYALNLYYAYGIRNGFGLDFDPVTGNLWDTENGPEFGDEINLVKPGFNSGWKDIQGIWNHEGGKLKEGPLKLNGLEDFKGKGKYSEPEFTWKKTVGATAIKFFNSDKMGTEYKNSFFIGDFHNGNIYHFDLNDNRTTLLLDGKLADRVADLSDELTTVTFAEGFGGITDLEVGPDGYLYVLSIGQGAIYKIVPK
jgi:aldose sugar dehydrogenase